MLRLIAAALSPSRGGRGAARRLDMDDASETPPSRGADPHAEPLCRRDASEDVGAEAGKAVEAEGESSDTIAARSPPARRWFVGVEK